MNQINSHMSRDERLRLKKALQFIREVIQDYGRGTYSHLGFSLALATSKAEELNELTDSFSPAKEDFHQLVEAMKALAENSAKAPEAEACVDRVFSHFRLEEVSLLRRLPAGEAGTPSEQCPINS